MSRRKRARHPHDDAIRNLQEWQDHQYDPGYRGNLSRLGLFSGSGHGRPAGRYIVYAFAAECIVVLMLSFAGSMGVPGWIAILLFVAANVAIAMFTMTRLIRAPGHHQGRARGRR